MIKEILQGLHKRENETIKGPPGYPLVGILPELWRDPLSLLVNIARTYGDVAFLPLGPERVYLISHPEWIKYIFNNGKTYSKGLFFEKQKSTFGNGLLTSEGTSGAASAV